MTITEEIIAWINEQLEARGHGAKGQLAEYLNVRNDVITRMLNTDPEKESRVIRAEELVKISEFFGAPPPRISDTLNVIDADFARIYNQFDEKKRAELKRYLEYLASAE